MSYNFTTVDGSRVEVNVAAAFKRMAADFKKKFGLTLHISSGSRTHEEQKAIFLSRYVTAGNINGRKVWDTRVWNGVKYHRVRPNSKGGTVAVPGTSNHEITGPNGPRSLDIYDSGANAGVKVRNSTRDKWMRDNAEKYGFENEGYNFNEPWHKTFRGKIGGSASDTSDNAGLKPTQRRITSALLNRRATPDRSKAPLKNGLKRGTVGNFVGWVYGESVNGNNVWLKGTSGNYFHSAGVSGGSNTKGLKDLNPKSKTFKRTVRKISGSTSINGRSQPVSNGRINQTLKRGVQGTFNAYTHGQSITQNGVTTDIWFRGAFNGNWFWAGNFSNRNVEGLPRV